MNINWLQFTPWRSLAGGVLIGAAASLLLLANGRIAGVSGILGGLLRPAAGQTGWRIAFLLGLLAAPFVYQTWAPLPAVHLSAGPVTLVLAGLLVGVGTRYGAGCTSGHGVCGLARQSPRSLVAVLCFMGAGAATVFALRHLFA